MATAYWALEWLGTTQIASWKADSTLGHRVLVLSSILAPGITIIKPTERIYLTSYNVPIPSQTGSATVDSGIPDGWMGLDIGPESTAQFTAVIEKAATIIWNGWVQ